MQIFNPASTTIVYGLLGVKLFFWYIPIYFVGYALFDSAFAIYLYAFVLLLPMTFTSMQAYEDFVINAYFWILLGILFRLPSLALSSQFANPSLPAGSPRLRPR